MMQFAHMSERYYRGHMDGSMGLIGLLLWLLMIAAIAALLIYLVRSLSAGSRTTSEGRDPLDIARERYAKGEITKVELSDIKKELADTIVKERK